MTTHTPGPWEVSGKAGWSGHNVIDRNKRSVASFPSSSKRCKEERDANASLIAAAPELLHAAIRVRARCQSMRFDMDAAAALDALSAAIARATGEQHG